MVDIHFLRDQMRFSALLLCDFMTREDIVKEAQTWIGTRYHHLGRKKGQAVDCVGLVMGVMDAFGLPYKDKRDYTRFGIGIATVMEEFPKWLDVIHPEHARPGDIIGFRLLKPNVVQHVGILSWIGIIHTHEKVGMVVETGIDQRWKKLIIQGFRFKGLEMT